MKHKHARQQHCINGIGHSKHNDRATRKWEWLSSLYVPNVENKFFFWNTHIRIEAREQLQCFLININRLLKMYLNTRKNVWKKERQKRNEEGSLTSIRNAIKQLSFACRVGFLFKFQALPFFVVLSNFSNVCVRGVWTALRISFSDRLLLFIHFFRSIALKYACICCCCCCNSVHSYATLYWCWCLNKMMKCFPFYFHQKLIVSFFFYSNAHSFLSRASARTCAHTQSLWLFFWAWLKGRSRRLCVQKPIQWNQKNSMLMFSLLIMSCTRLNYILNFGVPWLWETEANDMESSEYNLIWRFVACFFSLVPTATFFLSWL